MKRTFLILLIIIVTLSYGCSSKESSDSETIKILDSMKPGNYSDDVREFICEWYNEVLDGFGQQEISKSVNDSGAVAEFRVVYNIALLGYNYYSLSVFEDGAGSFKYMVHHYENFIEGEMLVDETVSLDEEQTEQLLLTIKKNDFWNIPTVHPDEDMGEDGTTVFIEGYYNGNSHLISMWEPEPKHGIYKINEEFAQFSETIEENPFEQWVK